MSDSSYRHSVVNYLFLEHFDFIFDKEPSVSFHSPLYVYLLPIAERIVHSIISLYISY